MIKISKVAKGSLGDDLGLKQGDLIRRINGERVHDFLDYYFQEAEDNFELEIETADGKVSELEVINDCSDIGITVAEPTIRQCRNKCIFCFVDQSPPSMRKTIFIRDDDYRYSFSHGNFITLTNLNEKQLRRIVDLRISPLYVSVHATDDKVRNFLLKIEDEESILEKLKFLTSNGIRVHTQVVVCPGINDGVVLRKSIEDLHALGENILSLAIVPVGLTKHRENLPYIRPLDTDGVHNIFNIVSPLRKSYLKKSGTRFVFPSDELYLSVGLDVPSTREYEDFGQIENGVGMVRKFCDDIDKDLKILETSEFKAEDSLNICLVTGTLMGAYLRNRIIDKIDSISHLRFDILEVENEFFGSSVTCAGLLVGKDILDSLGAMHDDYDLVLIPDNALNDDKLFLDDLTVEEIQTKTQNKILISNHITDSILNLIGITT